MLPSDLQRKRVPKTDLREGSVQKQDREGTETQKGEVPAPAGGLISLQSVTPQSLCRFKPRELALPTLLRPGWLQTTPGAVSWQASSALPPREDFMQETGVGEWGRRRGPQSFRQSPSSTTAAPPLKLNEARKATNSLRAPAVPRREH